MSTNAMPPINTASTEQANWVFDWLTKANVKLQLSTSTSEGMGKVFQALFGDASDKATTPPDGVWVARYSDMSGIVPSATELDAYRHDTRYSDMSGIVPFATELDAYRHANGTTMEVVLVPWGCDVQKADIQ